MSLTLRIQQRDFDAAVRLGVDVPGLLAAPAGGLQVYRHAYAARLIAALRDNLEVFAQALGDEAFDTLARAFLAAQPSRRPSIRWFGDGLPAFLQAHPALLPHPALIDLARMDWALRGAFDAADAEPIGPAALCALAPGDWPALCLAWHPSVQLLELDWHVEPAWRVLRRALDSAAAEPQLPEPQPGRHALLVWRRGLETQWRSLDDDAAALLRPALAGAPFALLCAAAAERRGEAAAAAGVVGALRQWLADALIVGVSQDAAAQVLAAC